MLTDARESDKLSSKVHNSDTAVESDVCIELLPTAVEVENRASVPMMLPAPRRQFTCFLRTKSEGAIGGGSMSFTTKKPLAVTLRTLSGSLQDQNEMKNQRGIRCIKLKRRTCEPVVNNFTQWPMLTQDTEVLDQSVCYDDRSGESSSLQQKVLKLSKNDDHDKCQKLPPNPQSSAKSSDSSYQPTSAIYWNCRYAGSTDTSFANAVSKQKVPTTQHINENTSEITCCTTVPLSTSNIVNVDRSCSAAGKNDAVVHSHVVVIKRRC